MYNNPNTEVNKANFNLADDRIQNLGVHSKKQQTKSSKLSRKHTKTNNSTETKTVSKSRCMLRKYE